MPQSVTHVEQPDDASVRVIGFGLRQLRRPPHRGHAAPPFHEWVRTLTALEDYRDIDVVLDWTGLPAAVRGQGEIAVSLFVIDRRGDVEDGDDLREDLCDLLHALDHLHQFDLLDAEERDARRALVAPNWVAEIRRRRERVGRWVGPVGFAPSPDRVDERVGVSLWPSDDGSSPTREELAVALLSQDGPTTVRFLLRPTQLSPEESSFVARQTTRLLESDSPMSGPASRAMASLCRSGPAFEVRVLVAGDDAISPALLSSIGFALSPPATPDANAGLLAGGYEAVRPRNPEALRSLFRSCSPSMGAPGSGRERRVHRVMDVWQAAAAARPPLAVDGTFAGIDVGMASVATTRRIDRREGLRLGQTRTGAPVVLPHADRMRHTYLLGQTGTGKSTLLLSTICDDLASDRGVAVIDPHGDLIEDALALVPERRWGDVVLIEPTDPHAVVGLNLLEAETEVQREFLVAELCAWMYALYDPDRKGIVGPRFESMLRYAALLLMDDEERWSIMEIPRLFTDHDFAKLLVARSADPLVREFWENDVRSRRSSEYGEVAAWFRSKFEPFRSVPALRRVLGQVESTVNLAEHMDRGGIVLANLSKGLLGEYNARLLGFVVFARLWAATMSRAQRPADQRREFHVYLDEAQTITTSSLPTILSEARKYGLSATLANQFFDQIPEELRQSILGNVGTKIAFRMGAPDAAAFATQYGGDLDPQQLRRLPNFEVLADVLVDGQPSEIQHVRTDPVTIPDDAAERRAAVRERSRRQWGSPLAEVDANFFSRYGMIGNEEDGPPDVLGDFLERKRRQQARTRGHAT